MEAPVADRTAAVSAAVARQHVALCRIAARYSRIRVDLPEAISLKWLFLEEKASL
jgi:hypothetical protein